MLVRRNPFLRFRDQQLIKPSLFDVRLNHLKGPSVYAYRLPLSQRARADRVGIQRGDPCRRNLSTLIDETFLFPSLFLSVLSFRS